MKYYKLEGLLQNDGWICPAYVSLDDQGNILSVTSENNSSTTLWEEIKGYAIPGFQNAHSHAFQYAMAGLAENHLDLNQSDDFWSWRKHMYEIALSIDPDQMEVIATMLYSEMLRHGYTSVAEFHYLHHDKNGQPYTNQAEMGERLIVAAQKAGINITLVPIFYQKGGFGKEPLSEQRRFISKNTEEYLELLEATQHCVDQYDHADLGWGLHSIRAVEENAIKEAFSTIPSSLPIHIHIAEQIQEIEDSKDFYGTTPAQWLLDTLPVNERFHLVHATHLVDEEVKQLAESKSHVVLCPSTEGNLGDGIFRLMEFQSFRGKWSIGTDSHIGLNPFEELRLLDYGQRLTTHNRVSFEALDNISGPHYGFQQALISGKAAMGNNQTDNFTLGNPFDALIIDASVPILQNIKSENILSTVIYSGDVSWNLGTMLRGEWVIEDGNHISQESMKKEFARAINELKIR